MNYLPFVLISYFLNSIAVTVDKVLLTKTIPDPLIYVFYFSLLSFLAFFGLPFTHTPTTEVFIMASASTLLWTLGAYCMFKALKIGLLQRVIPIIGVITPLTLLLLASSDNSITSSQALAIVILIFGLIFLTMQDWKGRFITKVESFSLKNWFQALLIKKELALDIFSGILFAFSYYLLRLAYLQEDFLTVLVYSRFILIPLAFLFLIIPSLRNRILPMLHLGGVIKKAAPLFVFGQISAGISELLLVFSISLASPAIVNSLQGVKYIYLLGFSLIIDKKFPKLFQIIGIGFIGIGLYLLVS